VEHPFGPREREALLAEARRDHAAAIGEGAMAVALVHRRLAEVAGE